MTLIENWKEVLKKAWSVKFNIASTLLGAAEVVVLMIQPEGVPNGIFVGLATLTSLLASVARVMAQKEMVTVVIDDTAAKTI